MFIENFLSFIVLIPSATLCLFPVKNQLKHSLRRMVLTVPAVLLLCSAAMAYLQTRLPVPDNAFLIPLILLSYTAYHRSLRVSVSKSLAIFCSAVALMSIIANLASCACAVLHHRLGLTMTPVREDLVQLGLSILVTLLLARPFLTNGSLVVDHADLPRIWNSLLLFSVVIFLLSLALLPFVSGAYDNPDHALYLLLVTLFLFLLWLLMQVLFYYTVTGYMAVAKAEERNRFLEAEESQYLSQQHYMKATERVRHDFRHSIRTLTELYDAGDTDAVGAYLHKYMESMPVSEVINYCGNTAVNALLNFYAHVAGQSGIGLTMLIDLPDQLRISDVDLCHILGNILENAVLACQKTAERFIQLTVRAENRTELFIVVVNSFDGKVRQRDGRYLSTNRNGDGIGLSSVASTAELYGGFAQFYHEGNRFYSNVAIPL